VSLVCDEIEHDYSGEFVDILDDLSASISVFCRHPEKTWVTLLVEDNTDVIKDEKIQGTVIDKLFIKPYYKTNLENIKKKRITLSSIISNFINSYELLDPLYQYMAEKISWKDLKKNHLNPSVEQMTKLL